MLGVLLVSDVGLADALEALSHVKAPPGRMQQLGGGDLPLVIVDYAHTPDALEKVLTSLRPGVPQGRRSHLRVRLRRRPRSGQAP